MIRLTRLNTHPLTVNSDLIKFVEQAPDTVLTLLNGEKVVVRESAEEVLNRIIAFRRSVLDGLSFCWDRPAGTASVPVENDNESNAKVERRADRG